MRNNILHTGFLFWGGAEKSLGPAQKNWIVEGNCYERNVRAPAVVPPFPGDLPTPPVFISRDPANPNYFRIPADSPLAKASGWPGYIGALPPGPAPKDGDWFTRLRERWAKVVPAGKPPAPPVQVPEPPPLAEWLKGRKILTVAQDGKGQFKTIQAALDALKPHQVVKVLDRGPYREVLRVYGGLPEDTGLISERQSVLEIAQWREGEFGSPSWATGHVFKLSAGFRLSGLRLLAPPRKGPGAIITWRRPAELVIEDCHFGYTGPTESGQGITFNCNDNDPKSKPIFVRNCLFDTVSLDLGLKSELAPVIVVERNYFKKAIFAGSGPRFQKVLIRHNVFDFPGSTLWIQNLKEVQELEIRNNTAISSNSLPMITLVQAAPKQGITFRNNISGSPVGLDGEASKVRAAALKNWLVDHNCYARRGALPKSPTDVVADPEFLSLDPTQADYLHIPADSPLAKGGAGGAWPSYIGAFPPGPAPKESDWFARLRQRWR